MDGNPKRADGSQLVGAMAVAIALAWLAAPAAAYEDDFGDEDQWQEWVDGGYRDPLNFSDDIVAAAELVGSDKVFVVGEFGLFGVLTVEGEKAEIELIDTESREDVVSVVALQDGTALAGGAYGEIFRYTDGNVEPVAKIHNDSVLGLGIERDAAGNDVAVWARSGFSAGWTVLTATKSRRLRTKIIPSAKLGQE